MSDVVRIRDGIRNGRTPLYYSGSRYLSIEAAAELMSALAEAIVEYQELQTSYVQVEFLGGSRPYTYRDPSGSLEIGDLVEVPTQYCGPNPAKVVGLGRNGWTGDCSDVSAKLVRTELA